MNNGFEVFEFKEEDGISELTTDKCFCRLRNPNSDDLATMECQFLECVAHGAAVQREEMDNVPCIDVGAIEGATPAASLGSGENEFAKEGNTDLDVSPESKATSSEQQPNLEKDIHKHGSTFTEFESRNSFSEAPSPGKRQLSCPLSSSPLSNEPIDMASDGNGSTSERSPPSPVSDLAEDDVSLNGNVVDHFDGNIPMDNIDREVVICPEYVLYQDNYYTGVSVIFSPGGIKIECSTVSYHHGAFSFERGVDDIINIHCQWFQRVSHEWKRFKLVLLYSFLVLTVCSFLYGLHGRFMVFDRRWSEKQEAITSLNHKYLAMWNIVFDPLMEMGGDNSPIHKSYFPNFDEPFEEVIYPKGDFDAVSISKRDVDLLEPETFINDTIIDFYIKYLKNKIEPEERQRFHFFNSFFFRKLADLDKDPSSISDGRAAFVRVRKWTRKLDMFGKDYIFVPVNFNLHWSLLVICHLGEVAAFKDEDLAKSSKVPCILHMDSIRGNHAGLKNLVQSYLWEEWKERHKETSEDLSSKFLNLRFVSLELPQQENSFDCGLFLLHYLELFLAEAPPNFNPFKITKFSNFLNLDWFPPTEASLKRTLIQKLIFELLEVRSQEISSSHCSDDNNSSEKIENENGVEFISGSFSTEVAYHGNLDSQVGRGIEMTLLASSSVRNMGSVNDSGLVLREFFDSGDTTEPLLGQFQSFDQPPYYNLNGAISPTEEVQTGQQFTYLASGEAGFPQFSGITPQACEPPYSSGCFGMGSTWNPGISMPGDHEVDTSSETSASGDEDDDDDIGIIECNPFQVNEERIERQDTVQEQSHLVENVVCLKKVYMPASSEVLETSISEVYGASEDTVKTWIRTVDADLCSTEDLPLLLHQNPGAAVNQLDQDPELIEKNAEKVEKEAIDDDVHEDLPSVDNSTLSSSKNPDISLKRLDQDSEPLANKEATADDFPPEDNSTVLAHQNPSTVLNQLNQYSEMVENKEANDHDVQITSNDMSAEIAEQPVAKRMRLMPSDEEKVHS
ncbi:O-fucosyltransferase family protein [Hibiscus syriacus]|uniref:O-fucosyltransferase family protein n=1 Tax=Hibiscus syriacus TaxID=106335 RepID=A0A6A2WPQ5_HIBSY|nr:O-fucosyltransferase family protein [Hibiscus syriacus]